MSPFPDYIPYREGPDLFEEVISGFPTRLHFDPATGHLRFLPVPGDEALDRFYNGVFIRSPEPPTPEKEFTPAVLQVARDLRLHMQSITPLPDDFIAHDIGCGFGALVHAFQQIGVQASGNEKNQAWIDAANPHCDFKLRNGNLSEALQTLPKPVDLFTILHVLEHLPEPEATIVTAAENLSENGVIYICVPNAHSFRVLADGRRKDPCYQFPQHLNYFTPLSLIRMLEAAGLGVVEMNTRPLFESDETEVNRIESKLGFKGGSAVDGSAWLSAQCSNLLGGELYVLACKSSNVSIKRDLDAISKAEKAFHGFNAAWTERNHDLQLEERLHDVSRPQARQRELIAESQRTVAPIHPKSSRWLEFQNGVKALFRKTSP